jgi:voltage-dependent anion channel protein 2
MSFPPLYKDIGKNANDLANKGFVSTDRYQWKVEVDVTAENGVQFLPSLTQTTSGSIDGELKTKFKACNHSFTALLNLKQELSLEAAADKPVRGLVKPTFTLSTYIDNPIERAKLKCQTEFRFNYGNVTASAEIPVSRFLREVSFKPEQPKTNISAVFGLKDYGVALGSDVEISPENGQVKAFNTVFSYVQSNLEASVFSKRRDASLTVGGNVYQRLAASAYLRDSSVGAELTHDFSDKPPTLTIAGTNKPDESSTLKGRVSSKGVVGLAYTQKFNGPFTLTVGADLDVLRARDVGSLQYGFKLAVK